MLVRVLLALGSLSLLATLTAAVFETAKWWRQETISAEVRSATLTLTEEGRHRFLHPVLSVELNLQADGALPVRQNLELPREELGFALVWLNHFAPRSVVSIRRTPGDPADLYLTAAQARESLEYALALALLAAVQIGVLVPLWTSRAKTSVAWLPFFTLGILALAIGLASTAYRSWQTNFWEIAQAQRVEVEFPPERLAEVVTTAAVRQRLAGQTVAWTEFEHRGKRVRLPAAACSTGADCVLLLNPYDAEDWTTPFDGSSDAWTPTWIGFFFGTVFTAAGWFIRKMESRKTAK